MRTIDLSPLYRSVVGFDRLALLNLLESAEGAPGYPPYNIERSDENHYRVTIAVAGFAEKDLGVSYKGNVLTVTGKREQEKTTDEEAYHMVERSYGSFSRSLRLPEGVNPDSIKASIAKGVLTVTVPKPAPAQTKKI